LWHFSTLEGVVMWEMPHCNITIAGAVIRKCDEFQPCKPLKTTPKGTLS
jgi:hypothetical protein